MSKAEKFIDDYTRNCSNEILSPYPQIHNDVRRIDGEPAKEFSPWLTPDQAKEAVEIAREEVIEWIDSHWREYVNVDADGVVCFGHWKNDLRKAMKDE